MLSTDRLKYISGLLKGKDLLSENIGEILSTQPIQEAIPIFFENVIPSHFQRDSFFVGVYNLLSDEIKNSHHGKIMKESIPLCLGQIAPDFTIEPEDGDAFRLSEIIEKSKLTVLHFWSSGSADRIKIHEELANAYKKYKNKGLEIVSVSLDANPIKWKRAVNSGGVPGIQFCDFMEEDSPIAKLYKMNPLNTINILIDESGKMIAWDVDGPALFGHLYRSFGE